MLSKFACYFCLHRTSLPDDISVSEEEVDRARPACPVCSTGCIVKWVAAQQQTLLDVAKRFGYAKNSAPYKALEQAAALQTKAILRQLKEPKTATAARPAARKPVRLVADDTAGLPV